MKILFESQNVDVSIRNRQGETARSLALLKGFTKVVSLIDNHIYANQRPLRSRPGFIMIYYTVQKIYPNNSCYSYIIKGLGRAVDTSSSEESLYEQRQHRPKSKLKGNYIYLTMACINKFLFCSCS